ncbi:NADP-dependent oxidoreductase [Streptomyces sp. AJS327]|uniref:NADP-dependent oxidoreductase n=1 Tax=Streptomyces sp. AJS327 TaxID=2545265 RepID=UPI0015DF1005|nr:NADP-dependent oxidoreductase [Streptomyces sp. AJS327]MBA0049978.1 NADP-dependent oxidoreductase [Streptomyces sp. AJS327]
MSLSAVPSSSPSSLSTSPSASAPGSTEAWPRFGRAWHLVSRPSGLPEPADFALREIPVVEPGAGEILVRNLHLSVDPYMRGRMDDVASYLPPFPLEEPLQGGAVGVVLASRAEGFAPGDHVQHMLGWREFATLGAEHAVPVSAKAAPLSFYLGALGLTGLTAYAGLLEIASLREGDAVFVSGAAGAVGSQVGQIARIKGASRVIGSAGSDAKVRVLTEEYGFDAAFNYRSAPVAEQLRALAPEGIDVYFDNVGGEHLEAAIDSMNVFGRAVICGMISQYNATEPPAAPRNLRQIVGKRLRLEGLVVTDHLASRPQFVEETSAWIRSGQLIYRETIEHGIENTVDAFLQLFSGGNDGKMIVSLAE